MSKIAVQPRILFLGSKRFGMRCLEYLCEKYASSLCGVITIDDINDERTAFHDIYTLSSGVCDVVCFQKGMNFSDIFTEFFPDIVFVSGWYHIIPPHLLALPSLGCIGFHFSLLPKYRGGAPLVWAMINGENEVGYSLFLFDSGMDTGKIYAQQSVPVYNTDYIADVMNRVEASALNGLRDYFPKILQKNVSPVAQSLSQVSYGSQRRAEDGRINWTLPAQDVYNWIRAQSHPYPGAFTFFEDTIVHIWNANTVDIFPYYATPGQVVSFDGEDALIGCGDNRILRISELTVNKEKMSPKDLFKTIQCRLH